MEISWGFIAIIVLILFPGLLFRRLYFYGEFSKQFDAGKSLIKLLSVSVIPGIINLICVFFLYDQLIQHIELEVVINTFKDLNNPQHKLNSDAEIPIRDLLNKDVFPFLSLVYFSSLFSGSLLGRLIRITRVDTRFKLLRFKNYWFYVFSGELYRFKKLRRLKEGNKKHLFTKVDILVDSNSKTHLYSGIIVDYELNDNNCQELNKVMLHNAERYKVIEGQRERVTIPGHLLLVDCTNMRNINFTYVFEGVDDFLKSRIPSIVDSIFAVLLILIIPFFFFQTEFIDWDWYNDYFSFAWYKKILCFVMSAQFISLFNPFSKNEKKGEFEYIGWELLITKIGWLLFVATIVYFI